MKIGVSSNSWWAPSGYGTQMKTWVESGRLASLGHKIVVHSNFGLQGAPQYINGILVYPTAKDQPGSIVLPLIYEAEKLDALITLYDAWVYDFQSFARLNWAPWFPLDHDPIPPYIANVIRTARFPIVYSKFAYDRFTEAGIKVRFVPHAIDTTVYKPCEMAAARKALGFPEDLFIVGMVAANTTNPSRKGFDPTIQAFVRFAKRHSDAIMYLHTDWEGMGGGVNIPRMIELAGGDPRYFAEPSRSAYILGAMNTAYMVNVFNSFNVLVNCAMGEGFGLPIAEGMACGVPAIVSDCTSMPELVDSGAGWKVEVAKFYTDMDSYQFLPSVDSIEAALEDAYAKRGDQGLRDQARAGMVKDFDADTVLHTHWEPVLAEIEAEIKAGNAAREARVTQGEAMRLFDVDVLRDGVVSETAVIDAATI